MPLRFAWREMSAISLVTGIRFLSPEGQQWIKSQTGENISVERLGLLKPLWEGTRELSSSRPLSDFQTMVHLDLPDLSTVQHLFEAYHSSLLWRIFPVLNNVLFHMTLQTIYPLAESSRQNETDICMRACVFAFVAFATFLHLPTVDGRSGQILPVDAEIYTMKAQSLLPQIIQGIPTLDGLQTIAILASALK
ncbi:hypothetical protein PENSUB_12548 [Penicillium subrubescens]|uniref:Transcription factor domain-containing protein n=1 Tax=Penicillium subrubescens TaxID=1316194 RepID=A0A1Q5SY76_9EURO|nr:hypothetical protein PENSUB_12548 [Penicillium subrubescens]